MENTRKASFDEFLLGYYGREREPLVGNEMKLARLLDTAYGKALAPHYHRHHHLHRHHHHLHGDLDRAAAPPRVERPAEALSLGHDDGEVLPSSAPGNRFRDYSQPYSISDVPFEEYVVASPSRAISRASSIEAAAPPAAVSADVHEEYAIDVLQPLKVAAAVERAPAAAPGQAPALHAESASPLAPAASPSLSPPTSPVVAAAPHADTEPAVSSAKSTDDDFIKDMQAILSGQKAFDVRTKSTVPMDQLGQMMSAPQPSAPAVGPNTSDDIFARLAQSMTYANAYDMGTVELENRFQDFDKLAEIRDKAAAEKKAKGTATPAPATMPGPADFIQDLDEIRRAPAAAATPANAPTAATQTSAAQSMSNTGLSRPLYDTGEHVLVGGNFYVDQLRVGPNPGVKFSYGQIIAMADLYETVDQMMGASVDELSRLKSLIERSTAYYAGNKADPSKDVSNKMWNDATGKRYMMLAESNAEHFSPNFLYPRATFASAANRHGNNKTAWETYHRRAIQEAQVIGAAAGSRNSSPLLPLEGPLITNAFGDHFLTDAFSAGHLINKDAITEFWKTMFFQGSALLPEAKAFFKKLATAAWGLGDVRSKFSALETVEKWHHLFHPNIDSADRFATLLEGIAEQKPDRIANMVVKAIHDRLNKDGVDVFNNAGDGSWRLSGDGTLNTRNRQIIQKAVEQSIGNINDPSIMASNIDFDAYFAKVWKHVPQLTDASQQSVQRVVRQYVDPASAVLVQAAAELIKDNVDFLVDGLLKAKALQPA